ncbi:NADPH-dependent FMN reductase [Psittacicella hinzii]|uniref:NADPH-dependent FMN reductase-like domain-containing protein n=1 Tax=Psittacicella hinzii TaxID=2028575 RepID=A0A3A1YR16_9GAMM|nr:NAD(P)H-dependent oxidoreductase [Psittacicella hinzii]RIY39380.1 hypothetical protein CKF58_02255 [Psittacicella hinzii]
MANVLVIKGSARKESTGSKATTWVVDTLKKVAPTATTEVIDLATFSLPLDAEPYIPAQQKYVSENTKVFAAAVSAADAVVFVTPEYNGSYPAALKNAIDHLFNEWNGKKALIVAYSPSGATSVVPVLETLLTRLSMNVVDKVALSTYPLGYEVETGLTAEFHRVAETETQAQLETALKAVVA